MTSTASLPLSAPPPPRSPDDFDVWLARAEAAYSVQVERALGAAMRAGLAAWGALTAAGVDDAAAAAQAAWLGALPALTKPLVGMYHSGAIAAWIGPRAPLVNPDYWTPVVNVEAVDYMRGATNRLVGVGSQTWSSVRSTITKAMAAPDLDYKQVSDAIRQSAAFSAARADTIARTEIVGAFNQGHLAGAQAFGAFGPVEKVWVNTHDGRTRETHVKAGDQVQPMAEPFLVGGSRLNMPGDPSGPAEEVINCRCTATFLYPGDVRPDGTEVPGAVKDWEPPSLEGVDLTLDRNAPSLGGAHPKQVYVGSDGRRYLFKPMDRDLAHAESLATELGRRAGLDMPRVYAQQVNGRWGSLQELLPNSRPGFPGSASAFDPLRASVADLHTMQQHRILDWLIGNHDAHAGQWIRQGYASQGADVIGIDKGQAFKHWRTDKLDWRYHPNAAFGEADPVYNFIERAYAENRLPDASWSAAYNAKSKVRATIDALQAIPDAEYRAMLRPYATARWGAEAEAFLDAMVARKNALLGDFTRYHNRLYAARSKVRKATAPPKLKAGQAGGPKGMAGAPVPPNTPTAMNKHDHPVSRDGSAYYEAARSYTGAGYTSMNDIRRGKPGGSGYARHVKNLEAGLPHGVKEDFIVYRGTSLSRHLPPGGPHGIQGHLFSDEAFMSTSVGAEGPAFGGDTLMVIRNTENTRGAWVHPISSHSSEREFLIDGKHTSFYVHKVSTFDRADPRWGRFSQRGFKWVVELEAVDPAWAASQGLKTWNSNAGVWA